MSNHNANAEWYECVIEEDEDDENNGHCCELRVHHEGDHKCPCGYSWERSPDDAW